MAAISHAAMRLLGWLRVDRRPWTKTNAVWRHYATHAGVVTESGWTLNHCGHPTALHPWVLKDGFGNVYLTGVVGPKKRWDFGTAWNDLRAPAEWLDRHLRGEE